MRTSKYNVYYSFKLRLNFCTPNQKPTKLKWKKDASALYHLKKPHILESVQY